MSSTTRLVKTSNIAKLAYSSVLLRLMMAVNDLGLINNALREWNTSTEKKKIERRSGGRIYFVRVQMAHVFEALEIIKEIRDDQALMAEVEKCSKETQVKFAKVKEFLETPDYGMLAQIRNGAAFHYEPKRPPRAVSEIAAKFSDDRSAFTLGHDPLDWYFELGDKVISRIIVRKIYKVAEDADVNKEFDAIAGRIFDMAEAFAEFAGYFVWERGSASL